MYRITGPWLDQEFGSLAELQAFAGTYTEPQPIDETYTEWQVASTGEWSPCVADSQWREVVYTRTVKAPAQYGGASGGLLEMREIETGPCVVPPPPPPTELTFSENWRELWPDWTPKSLPPQGSWAAYEGVNGSDIYPERRYWLEAQWHDAADGNLEHARHMHIGAWFPERVDGVFQLDVRLLTFHWQGGEILEGLRKNPIRGLSGVKKVAPSPIRDDPSDDLMGEFDMRLTDHMHKVWLPIRYDPRGAAPPGLAKIQFDQDIQRHYDNVHHLARLLANIALMAPRTPQLEIAAEGWMDAPGVGNVFGYLNTKVLGFGSYPDYEIPLFDDAKYNFFRARPGIADFKEGFPPATAIFRVSRNPDLHNHPPLWGDELIKPTNVSTAKQVFQTPPRDLKAGDRYVFHKSIQTPNHPHGSVVTLLVIGIGKSRGAR